MTPLGVYVHVPFCAAICNYCNFSRGLLDAALARRYARALLTDIRRLADGSPSDTLYFGGGTPSLLDPAEIGAAVAAWRDGFTVPADAEVTLEVNPETVDTMRLAAFRAAGVNRLSIGVQSFRDEELRRLGRLHDAARAGAVVGEARAAGFDNISLDLMMWLPGQSPAEWCASVRRLIELSPEHASLYLLEVYPNAPLRDEMARGGWEQAPDEAAATMYREALELLDAAGYEHYEISNVARPGRQARHNMKYWEDGDWLAVGCAAHGSRGLVRWRNLTGAAEYAERVEAGTDPSADRHVRDEEEACADAAFMGLRLAGGVDLDALRARYGVDLWDRHAGALAPFLEAGLLVREGGRLRLTREGFLLANDVMAVFV
jgi:oxygen-independent coproporphyrinogen-3 oxidase